VSYGGGFWAAVGDSGLLATAAVKEGPWTQVTSGFGTDRIYGVAHAQTGFAVAVGDGGKISYSSTGTTWTLQDNSFSGSLIYTIEFGGFGVFLAGGASGKASVSRTGATVNEPWIGKTSNFGSAAIRASTFGFREWVVVGELGTIATATR
jgi:hypothetical protein